MKRLQVCFASFLGLLLLVSAAAGIPTVSATEKKRIILIKTMPVTTVNQHCEWFMTYLERYGYVQGKNLDLVVFDARGDRDRAEKFLRTAMVEKQPDLVATSATLASQAAYKVLKGTRIPLVFFTVSDPVGAGLIKKVGHPTKINITGKVNTIDRETRIDIVRRLINSLPGKRPFRIGLIHTDYPSSMGDLRELRIIEKKLDDIQFLSFPIKYQKVPAGLPSMLKMVKKTIKTQQNQIDFWWELSGPLGELPEYTRVLITESTIPIVMGHTLESVAMGALVYLRPSSEGSGKEAALLAAAILKGTDPGTLPVTPPSTVNLGLNLTTALKLGIVIPPGILSLAGDNVFR